MDSDTMTLILELGTGVTKIGWGGDDEPRGVFPTLFGEPRNPNIMVGLSSSPAIGDNAHARRGILTLTRPLQSLPVAEDDPETGDPVLAVVTAWDPLFAIISHAFHNEIHGVPSESHVLLSHPLLSQADLSVLEDHIRETHKPLSLTMKPRPVFALQGAGLSSGIVLSSGYSSTYSIGVADGKLVPGSCCVLPFAGKDATEKLMAAITAAGFSTAWTSERELPNHIKRSIGSVEDDLDPVSYVLPDGQSVVFDPDLRSVFLDPLWDSEAGIPSILSFSIQATISSFADHPIPIEAPIDIVLCGGNTLFPGFPHHIRGITQSLSTSLAPSSTPSSTPSSIPTKLHASPDRRFISFIGASLYASLTPPPSPPPLP